MPVVANTSIKVEGTILSTDLSDSLIDVRISLPVGAIAHCSLSFRADGTRSAGDIDKLISTLRTGKQIEVLHNSDENTSQSVFKGEVRVVEFDLDGFDVGTVVVEALDHGHIMALTPAYESHLDGTESNVLSEAISACGLSADVPATATKFDNVMVIGSVLDVVEEISSRHNWIWWVEDKKVRFATDRSSASVTLENGVDLVSFSARFSAVDRAKEVEFSGWDPDTQQRTSAKSTLATQPGPAITQNKPTSGVFPVTPYVTSLADAPAVGSKAVKGAIESGELTGRGVIYPARPDLHPSRRVKITGLGTELSGDYSLSSVEHRFDSDGFVTLFEIGPRRPASLVDLVGGSANPNRVFNGLTIGVVTSTNDPDKLNRIKVKLPYLQELETGWIRVVQQAAGLDHGAVAVPHVDDEVVIGFEQGDLRHPYVLGGLWSKVNKPPMSAYEGDGINVSGFQTPKKNLWKLTDPTAGSDKAYGFTVELDTGTTLQITKEKVLLKAIKSPIEFATDMATVKIDENGNITIDAQSLTVNTKDKIEMKATGDLTVEGANVNSKAQVSSKLEASSSMTVQSSGQTAVKGSIVQVN